MKIMKNKPQKVKGTERCYWIVPQYAEARTKQWNDFVLESATIFIRNLSYNFKSENGRFMDPIEARNLCEMIEKIIGYENKITPKYI